MIDWGLIATWVGLLGSVCGVVYAMGKQTQKIESQQHQIDELKDAVKDTQELPIKLATLETDIKYLVQGMAEIKSLLIKDLTGVK